MLIDTHCHLYFDDFNPDRNDVLRRAREAGVAHLVNVGTDPATNRTCFDLAKQHDFISYTAGLHPHHSHEVPESELAAFERFIKETKPVAIGEIGLDYFKSQAEAKVQKNVFVRMLHLAMQNNLPVIVHSRDAFNDTFEILKKEGKGKLRGVMHCFSYDKEALSKLIDIGFLASFTGNLTFKNANALLEVAAWAPLDCIMLETDSPYLSPIPYRGKRNEPAYLKNLAEFLAYKRGISFEVLANTTSQTAIKFFNLKVSYE